MPLPCFQEELGRRTDEKIVQKMAAYLFQETSHDF